MSDGESELQKYYAARASEYDQVYFKPERQADLRKIESWLPLRFDGEKVLEVACGTGYWTQFIAPAAGSVMAIDSSPETLHIAENRVARGNVRFFVGDAYDLPQHLGKFSAAFAGFWFSHVPTTRRRAFLRGLAEVLLPGAHVVFLDNRYVEGSSTPIAGIDSDGNTYQERRLKDGSTHRVLKNFPSESDLRASLDGLGVAGNHSAWQHYWAFEYLAAAT